jgi:hypothetical protein
MILAAWLFVGGVGLLCTVGAVLTDDDAVAIGAGTLGFVWWAVWTYGALNVEVHDGGVLFQHEMAPVALLGLTMAAVGGYIALTGPVELFHRAEDTNVRDI